jgi:hypothetical protein
MSQGRVDLVTKAAALITSVLAQEVDARTATLTVADRCLVKALKSQISQKKSFNHH